MKEKRERESDMVDMRGSEWISKQWINNWSYVIMWRLFYVQPQVLLFEGWKNYHIYWK